MKQVAQDKTLIIVEHKINEVVDVVDRIIVLSPEGKIVADGQAEQVFANERDMLKEYGIWYPGVWEERGARKVEAKRQDSQDAFKHMTSGSGNRAEVEEDDSRESGVYHPALELRQFTGLRGRIQLYRSITLTYFTGIG